MPMNVRPVDPSGMPPIPRWLRDALIALFGLYVLEVVLVSAVLPAERFYAQVAWFDAVAAPWQVVTRYFVQGLGSSATMRVVFDLLLLYFLVPALGEQVSRREASQVLAAAVVGGTVAAGSLAAVGFVGAPALGWHALATGALALFGWLNPGAIIRFNLLIPVSGRVIAWGTGVISALIVLGDRTMGAADDLGAWIGVLAWYHLWGPGGRRRQLAQQGRRIERKAQRFQVLPGGKDEMFH